MADNVAISAGTGTNIATDDISNTNKHYQKVKNYSGTADSEVAISDDNGALTHGPVAIDAVAVGGPLICGGRASKAVPSAVSADGDAQASWLDLLGASIMKRHVNRQRLTATPTVTAATTNYTVATATVRGDAVGGVLSWAIGTTLRDNGPAKIVDAFITDRGAKAYWLRLHLWGVNPTSPAADNATLDLTDANSESAHYLGYIDFRPGDASIGSSNAWCVGSLSGLQLNELNSAEVLCDDATNKTTIYGQLEIVAAGAVAVTFYASTTDLIVTLIIDTPYA